MFTRNFLRSRQSFDQGFLSGLFAGVIVASVFFGILTSLCILALPANAAMFETVDSDGSHPEPRSVGEIRRDAQAFVKRSKVDDIEEKTRAVVNLCMLHHEIVTDPRFATNDRLKSFRALAATRLKKVKKEIELELKRAARAAAKSANSAHAKASDKNQDAKTSKPSDEMSFETYHEIVANEFESMSQFTGGPIRIWSYAGGPQCDYGEDLVELITNTINPDFWRVNGGEGIIHYYQPLRIIVVSGTAKMHDDLTDMLNTMRQLSR